MSSDKSDEANNLVTKLKADGSARDECDLGKVFINYKSILSELPAKDRGTFSLNVLCILCRNLEKVPTWCDRISNKELLELSIDCLRQTRVLKNTEQVKTLACVYHIHKHIVRQNTSAPPELMLKLSYMPFEVKCDNLLKEYYKTYWSILADRFVYIEKLKSSRLSIVKLLPKLNEDITTIIKTVLRSFRESCEATEKLGYRRVMDVMYPYIAQLLRLHMEYYILHFNEKSWKEHFDVPIQVSCLGIVRFLIKKLGKAQQMSKCEGCNIRSGLHDALRLSFLSKSLVSGSISQDLDVAQLLPTYISVVQAQYAMLSELNKLGCPNQAKCLRKLQTDVHNTAIALNKAHLYEHSIKLFNTYLKAEIQCVRSDAEFKNVARALYNKSISELDCKLYEEALKSAYLSLAFSGKEGLTSVKYMSLVMDIKAKSLKSFEDDEESEGDKLQRLSVLGACKLLADSSEYGNLKPFFSTLRFSELLKHEFSMYVKLWPSIVPIAGVWLSLNELLTLRNSSWLAVENEETLLWSLYQVVLETPMAVRTIHNEHYKSIVGELLQRFEEKPAGSFDEMAVHATLLFLQSEYDIAEASQKYGWKATGPILDPDLAPVTRTLPLEHQALLPAFRAVNIWTDALPHLEKAAASKLLHCCLQIAELFVQHLLNMFRHVQGLQLAHVCCELARRLDAKEEYVRNAGVILFYASKPCQMTEELISTAAGYWSELMKTSETLETALVFACELATFYQKCGSEGTAAMLLQFAQARLLEALDTQTGINLDLAIGRLLEWARAPCILSRANAAHRHYLAIGSSGSRWCARAWRGQAARGAGAAAGRAACAAAVALRLWRRARASAAASLPASAALQAARLHASLADPHCPDAQVKIDNRLKHSLGLQPTNETQPQCRPTGEGRKGGPGLVPLGALGAQIEGVREGPARQRARKCPSPGYGVAPPFRAPEFLGHGSGCECYACAAPYSAVLAFRACALEAAVYYRSGEFAVAADYFAGAFRVLAMCEEHLERMGGGAGDRFQGWLLQTVGDLYREDLRRFEAEATLEAALFEMARGERADDKLVRVHEMALEWQPCGHLANEVANCLVAAARLTRAERKRVAAGLEVEMEALRLSPAPEPAKTPETRPAKQERAPNRTVADEELPAIKRKVIRLNLDEDSADEAPEAPEAQAPPPRSRFKVPVPSLQRPALEAATPRPKPQPLAGPPTPHLLFSTPCATSPERFFTPMTSVKSYSRRGAAVKNLESEFSTPVARADKENKVIEKPKTRGRARADAKRSLHRATSPGALPSQKR
ncbi:unnamed protein product, partial [Iphiclides podalirius]